jgi:hypothetical protein
MGRSRGPGRSRKRKQGKIESNLKSQDEHWTIEKKMSIGGVRKTFKRRKALRGLEQQRAAYLTPDRHAHLRSEAAKPSSSAKVGSFLKIEK